MKQQLKQAEKTNTKLDKKCSQLNDDKEALMREMKRKVGFGCCCLVGCCLIVVWLLFG